MPFDKYKDFAACVAQNKDKRSPEAFCAYLHHKVTGKWPSEKNVTGIKVVSALTCPVCRNPVKVEKALVRLKCPKCSTQLVSVKIRRK